MTALVRRIALLSLASMLVWLGANQHGSTEQFLAAVGFFAGKNRL